MDNARWQEVRKRKKLWLFAFIGYVPFCFAFALLAHQYFHHDKLIPLFAILWMLFVAIAAFRYIALSEKLKKDSGGN
jgi:uncharacterized membrane protein YsdA (DUF1294 family)